jgi:hypothetical protein
MSADLGFSEAVFGLGAEIFYAGYILLEIPGALMVERWSAKIWMSRIMITWGLCMAWVTTLAAIQAPTATVVNKAILSRFHRSSSAMMGGQPGYTCRWGLPISPLDGLVNRRKWWGPRCSWSLILPRMVTGVVLPVDGGFLAQ